MARLTSAQAAQKWANNTQAASQYYTQGINAVQNPPGQAAAAQKATYLARVQESQDKWARKVAAVSLQDWKSAAVNVGAQRISSGVAKASPRMQRVFDQLLPAVDAAASQVKQMPKATLQDRKNRMLAFVDAMSKFQMS